MIKAKFIPLCSALLVCGLAFGQTDATPPAPPAPPSPSEHAAHEVSFLTQMLSLTPEQQAQVTAIVKSAANNESAMRSSMDAAHKALQTAIEGNDSAGIAVAAEKIGQLTAQQTQAHAMAEAGVRALLTPDQLSKFKAFHGHGPHGMGGPGPDGAGAPPPPPPPGA